MNPESDARDLRQRAESRAPDPVRRSDQQVDPVRLLHELQVHQIELEIQNEDMLLANQELDALRMKYQALFEAAPVGYLMLSTDGVVSECNPEALKMLGREPGAVLGAVLQPCFDLQGQVSFSHLLSQVRARGRSGANGLLLMRPHGAPICVRAEARLVDLPQRCILLALMDVSALK